MNNFIQLLTAMFDNLGKSPGARLMNMLTVLIVVATYLLITYFPDVIEYGKNFSTSKVLQDVQVQREQKFPAVSTEKIMAMYNQLGADAVFVMRYEPEAVNDYQKIIAWEGKLPLDKDEYLPRSVDKSSELYTTHLSGVNYAVRWDSESVLFKGRNIPVFRNQSFDFVYTCPFFNLNNIYSGYVGVAWINLPTEDVDALYQYEKYLASVCSAPARALGRAI